MANTRRNKYVEVGIARERAGRAFVHAQALGGYPDNPILPSSDLYPEPTCHKTEPRWRKVFDLTHRSGNKLVLHDGTPLAQVSRRRVYGLSRWESEASEGSRMSVLEKNPECFPERVLGFNAGAANVLVASGKEGARTLFVGVQTRHGIEIIRPISPSSTPEFLKTIQKIFARKKSTGRK